MQPGMKLKPLPKAELTSWNCTPVASHLASHSLNALTKSHLHANLVFTVNITGP